MKPTLFFAVIMAIIGSNSLAQSSLNAEPTLEELRAQLMTGEIEACNGVSRMALDLIDIRQEFNDFQISFNEIIEAIDQSSITGWGIAYSTQIIAAHPRIEHAEALEIWSVQVYALVFADCMRETRRRSIVN